MKTFLDWSAYKDAGMGDAYADIPKHGGDYAKAIAVCINSRQCEAEGKQVMCPSFKVTQNPNLSTGGRVKLLKAALQSDEHNCELFQPELVEAMSLCVSCKGCKRECENNIDMPLIKAEYMAQFRERHGGNLRSALFASTPRWLHQFPWLRHLIKLRNRSGFMRSVTARLLGLNPDMALPVPSGTKPDWPTTTEPFDSKHEKPVVILADTFSRHFEPEVVSAALRVLKSLGYAPRVLEPPKKQQPYCCGRTYLAQGMVTKARENCSRLVNALEPFVVQGIPIVGMEASCVLGLRDDAKALGLGDVVNKVASATLLLEEFLAKESKTQTLAFSNTKTLPEKLLIHGHCHQKAVGAMKSVRRLLKLIPGLNFTLLDTGCCGMAGTFGLEREHAEISSKMAQTALLPSLKSNLPGETIANGFSCRHQIEHTTGNRPRHLAQFLAELSD